MYVGFFHENRRCMNKIVYVEDEPEVGQLIAAYLGKHDMDVIVEPRGDRAEEVVVRENPDLVLLDIMLPGKDGMTLCRDLRARWEGPIVLLTSLDSDMNHILSLEMGANDYILKTTPPAVLLARLRRTKRCASVRCLLIRLTVRCCSLASLSPFPPQILTCCGSWQRMPGRSWTVTRC